MNFQSLNLSSTNGSVHLKTNDPAGMGPELIMAGLSDVLGGVDGVPTPEGIVPGLGFISGGNPNAPIFIVLANKGVGTAPDSRSILMRMYAFQAQNQGCDPGIEVLTASGSFDHPAAIKAGDRIGKFVGMGHNGNGYYPNESASFSMWADQDFAPLGPTIRAGGSASVATCDENTNTEVFRSYWDSKGNLYIGNKHPYANNFPVKRAIILQECAQAPTGNADGAGILFVQNGALKYCGASGSITTIAPA